MKSGCAPASYEGHHSTAAPPPLRSLRTSLSCRSLPQSTAQAYSDTELCYSWPRSHLTSSCSPIHALRSPLPDHMHPTDPKACSWQPGVTADTFSKPEVPLHCLRVGISFPLFHRPFHFSISDGFLKEKHTNHKNTHFRCILNFFFF